MSALRLQGLTAGAGAGLRLVLTLLAAPLLIRGLGIERYGVWVLLVALAGLASVLHLGLDTAVMRAVAAARARGAVEETVAVASDGLFLLLAIGLAVAVAFLVCAPMAVSVLLPGLADHASVEVAARVLAVSIPFRFFQTWACSVEAGLLRYDRQAWIESFAAVLLNAGLIGLAWFASGTFRDLAAWTIAASVAAGAAHAVFLRQALPEIAIRVPSGRARARELLRFGSAQWVSNIGGLLFMQADRLVVGWALGPSSVGLYAVATGVTARINELSAAPLQSVVPAVGAAAAVGDREAIGRLFRRALHANAALVHVLVVPVILLADPLARLLVGGEGAAEVARLLRILAPVYGLYSLNAAGYFTLAGLGAPGLNALAALAGGVVSIALIAVLAPLFGLQGAAWANAGYLITLAINVGAARRTGVGIGAPLGATFRTLSGFAVLWGVVLSIWSLGAGTAIALLLVPLGMLPLLWIDPVGVRATRTAALQYAHGLRR